ncbi:Superoxide dismutase copper/zinc binding domain [Trinorchestia longiramus]|nr:Superoxide dismutase copper/zinc binding domain [Trinorchestia longiramus]
MGKCVGYTAGAITFMAIGALVTGLALYFTYPGSMRVLQRASSLDAQMRLAKCKLVAATSYEASGTIYFSQNSSSSFTYITGTVEGLSEGLHGFHIHEFGAPDGGCTAAGSHFNPHDEEHGGPTSDHRHVGDLGNIDSIAQEGKTVATVEIMDEQVTLYGDWSVLGRAVVIHAGEDDLGASGDSAGAAGARVACCTIYISPE